MVCFNVHTYSDIDNCPVYSEHCDSSFSDCVIGFSYSDPCFLKQCHENKTATFYASLTIDKNHLNSTLTLGNIESSFGGYYGLLVSACLLAFVLISIAAVAIFFWWKKGAKFSKFWKRTSSANPLPVNPPTANPTTSNPANPPQTTRRPKRKAPPPPPVLPFWPENHQSFQNPQTESADVVIECEASSNNDQNDASAADIEAANRQDESFTTENTYESLDQPEPIPQENPYLIDFSCYGVVPSNLNNV